jgi:hypothetical protein
MIHPACRLGIRAPYQALRSAKQDTPAIITHGGGAADFLDLIRELDLLAFQYRPNFAG